MMLYFLDAIVYVLFHQPSLCHSYNNTAPTLLFAAAAAAAAAAGVVY